MIMVIIKRAKPREHVAGHVGVTEIFFEFIGRDHRIAARRIIRGNGSGKLARDPDLFTRTAIAGGKAYRERSTKTHRKAHREKPVFS